MVSYQYALAIFDLTQDDTEDVLENFQAFMYLIKNKELSSFLNAPSIDKSEKKKVLESTFLKFEPRFLHFIYVLIDNNRLSSIDSIYHEFYELVQNKKGYVCLDVYTSVAITKEQEEELIKIMAPKFSGKVRINNVLDDSVIGGIRIEHNGESIDQTLQTQIHKMKAFL